LASTFFERLAEREAARTESSENSGPVDGGPPLLARLTLQYRMHAAIMAFPSASHYGASLIADTSVAAHRLEDLPGLVADPLRPGPLVFIDTAGKGWEERRGAADPSTSNPEQAERVAAELRRLLSRGLGPELAGLITPYRAQARRLRELLAPERAAGLEIDTIDAFQGREKEAIVVDLVRCNPDGQIGFLADLRRMNVALTRARRCLLVVGDSATIGQHPFYADFLSAVEAEGTWISAWNDEAEPL
jgi:superfamily I DNA and/or RNA helicase